MLSWTLLSCIIRATQSSVTTITTPLSTNIRLKPDRSSDNVRTIEFFIYSGRPGTRADYSVTLKRLLSKILRVRTKGLTGPRGIVTPSRRH